MGKSITLYVGLDVHKDSIDLATCTGARDAKPEHLGTVGGGLEPVTEFTVLLPAARTRVAHKG